MSESGKPRLVPALLVLQGFLISSPVSVIDGLSTGPRAFGAQFFRADPAASLLSAVPFLLALLPLFWFAAAWAFRSQLVNSRRTALVLSSLSLLFVVLPRTRTMTLASPVLHGALLAAVAAGTLVLVLRSEVPTKKGRSIRRQVLVGGTGWFLLLAFAGASSSSIPTGPASAMFGSDGEFHTAESSGRFDVPAAAQNPFLAPNPDSNIHSDGAMTDVYENRTPIDPREAHVLTRHLGGVCASVLFDEDGNVIAVCVNATKVRVNILDPVTLEVLARKQVATRPFRRDFPTYFAGGGYAVLDNDGLLLLATADGRVTRWSLRDGSGKPEIQLAEEFDVSKVLVDDESINSAIPDATGVVWFVGTLGTVGVLDPEDGGVEAVHFEGTDIENSFAVAKDGGAWVVTSEELVLLELVEGEPVVTWRESYDAGTRRKPGQTSRASGTTPTLMLDEKYVAITDNADPRMHVLVYTTDKSVPEGQREVCREPVLTDDESASDNALIALGNSLFVENNYGYALTTAVNGRSAGPGMTRIDLAEDGSGCKTVWENKEVRIPSVVSKGTASGVIVTYTKPESIWGVDEWFFTALDANTGDVMWKVRAGTGPMVNNHYAATYLGPDGSIYTGVTGGMVALVPKPDTR